MAAVRKLVGAKSDRVLPVKLHREDVQELVALFARYCESHKISDNEYVYDALDEIGKGGTALSKLDITGTNPGIRLILARNGSWLQQVNEKSEMTPEEIDKRDVVFARVKDFLFEHRTPTAVLFYPGAVTFYCLLVATVGLVVTNTTSPKSRMPGLVLIGGLLCVVVLLTFGSVVRNSIGEVTMRPKHEATSFFKRKKDEFIMLVIGTIFGSLATLLVEHFKK